MVEIAAITYNHFSVTGKSVTLLRKIIYPHCFPPFLILLCVKPMLATVSDLRNRPMIWLKLGMISGLSGLLAKTPLQSASGMTLERINGQVEFPCSKDNAYMYIVMDLDYL